jgi:hypothetical protein
VVEEEEEKKKKKKGVLEFGFEMRILEERD